MSVAAQQQQWGRKKKYFGIRPPPPPSPYDSDQPVPPNLNRDRGQALKPSNIDWTVHSAVHIPLLALLTRADLSHSPTSCQTWTDAHARAPTECTGVSQYIIHPPCIQVGLGTVQIVHSRTP